MTTRHFWQYLTAALLTCGAVCAPRGLTAQTAVDDHTAPQRRLHLSPYLGVGAREETGDLVGPQIHVGAHLEADLGGRIRLASNVGGWTFPLTCTPSGDPSQDRVGCAGSGWMADAGVNLRLSSAGTPFAPYIGGGVGAMKMGDIFAAANVRVGADLWSRSRVGLRTELRYQRLFGAFEPTVLLFSAGARFTLPG